MITYIFCCAEIIDKPINTEKIEKEEEEKEQNKFGLIKNKKTNN